MDTDRLLKELAKRDIVSRSVLKKLETKLADKSDVPSPRAVAKFLVDKGHLTAAQAKRALKAILTPEESAILESQRLDDEDEGHTSDLPSLSNLGMPGGEADAGAADLTSGGLGADEGDSGAKKSKKKKKKGGKSKGQNEWDTPLILLGGGGLILLLLIGGTILYVMGYEGAEERFKNAQELYDNGSYPQAIAAFETYLEKHPEGEDAGLARVRLGTARIRVETDVKRNFESALTVAKEETDVIEDQEDYREGQAELAALIPAIAEQLAGKADEAQEIAAMEKYVDLTEQALVLWQNPKLIPSKLRDKGHANEVREVLERIRQRQVALESLEETLTTMQQASASGDPKAAYAAHTAFVKENPQLADDQRVIDAVAAAAKAEEELVTFVADARQGETDPPESPVVAELAVASPRVSSPAPADGPAVLHLAGGLYGVSAADGKLLWRRYVGAAPGGGTPITIGDDLIVVDARRKELTRLQRATGQLVWRTPLGETLAAPVLVGDRVLAPTASGRLYIVDAKSGDSAGYVQFAQPLLTQPAASPDGKTIYLTGEHSSLYSLSADDLSCRGVYYLGHAKGAIATAPVALLNRVLVFENDGAKTSTLNVLGVAEGGTVDRSLRTHRLNGLVTARPNVFARRLAVATDQGHVDVFEVSADDDADPIVLLASRQPTRSQRGPRYALVNKGELWLAEQGLFRYSISPSGNRLPVLDVAAPFRQDTFIHPLQTIGDVVVHARKRRGRPGVAITATDLRDGKSYWQTDLAAPPAGAPVSRQGGQGVIHATAAGSVYRVGKATGRYTVLAAPQREAEAAQAPPIFDGAAAAADGAVYWDAVDGRAAFAGADSTPEYRLAGPLACEPTPIGDAWIVPLRVGQVLCIDGKSGEHQAAPFQPVLQPGQEVAWRVAAVSGTSVVIADGGAVYSLELIDGPSPKLVEVTRVEAQGPDAVSSRIAAAGGLAFAARESGSVTALSVDNLAEAGSFAPGAAVLWGPYAVSDERVLLATSADELICLEVNAPGKAAWRSEVSTAELVGAPAPTSRGVLLATRSGSLLTLDAASGDVSGSVDVGQRIAAGPAVLSDGLAVATPDGALVFVSQP